MSAGSAFRFIGSDLKAQDMNQESEARSRDLAGTSVATAACLTLSCVLPSCFYIRTSYVATVL